MIDKGWCVMAALAVKKILWVCGWEGGERFVGEDMIFGMLCMVVLLLGSGGDRVCRWFWIMVRFLLDIL